MISQNIQLKSSSASHVINICPSLTHGELDRKDFVIRIHTSFIHRSEGSFSGIMMELNSDILFRKVLIVCNYPVSSYLNSTAVVFIQQSIQVLALQDRSS